MTTPRVDAVSPGRALPEACVSIHGEGFSVDGPRLPVVTLGGCPARVVHASSTRIDVKVPEGVAGTRAVVVVEDAEGGVVSVDVATACADALHQVDSPVFDRAGNLYLTYSGRRGERVPVSIFRIRPDGAREAFSSSVVNPTSMTVGPDGRVYVSSRFEGVVYRLHDDGSAELFASDLGVPCGLAFGTDGTLFVGDRTGTVFAIDPRGRVRRFVSLPSSVAAFHLAMGPDESLYVAGPTLAAYDVVYRVDPLGRATIHSRAFGRPQGLALDRQGAVHVVESLAGASGVYRLATGREPELVLTGVGLIGLAFPESGGVVVCSSERAYRLP